MIWKSAIQNDVESRGAYAFSLKSIQNNVEFQQETQDRNHNVTVGY